MYRIAVVAIIVTVLVASYAADETMQTFQGEVSDSQCAMNIHSLTRSHREMLKGKSMGKTAGECSRYCIEHLGGKLVLASGKDVRYLDGNETIMQYLGKKVRVGGTLDKTSNTVHVATIEALK